jgi:hypothetical protein
MLIFLAGLNSSHLRSNSSYSQAAGVLGAALVSFFDYVDPSHHAVCATHIIPPQSEANHERQVNNES